MCMFYVPSNFVEIFFYYNIVINVMIVIFLAWYVLYNMVNILYVVQIVKFILP